MNKSKFFKGTKSHGDSWKKFISDSHFAPRNKDDIYGIVFTHAGKDVWCHIYDKNTNKKLDECTWVFWEEDFL